MVAATRVLTHRAAKPPTPEQIAELLGVPPDFARTLVVTLGDEGVLKVVENPFELRVEIADYARLEDLPREADGPTISDELDTFMQKKRDEYEATKKMLDADEIEKKQKKKMSRMEEEMKKMKDRGPSPFD